jgi:hypothetical protein
MYVRKQWTYRTAYKRMQEMQMDIDNIIKNNKERLDNLKESLELNELRNKVTSETREFMEKYEEINDEIDSEVVKKVLDLYMEYYAALVGYLGVGYTKGYVGAQYPGIAFGSAWDERNQNSEMVLMEDLLARLGEYA